MYISKKQLQTVAFASNLPLKQNTA